MIARAADLEPLDGLKEILAFVEARWSTPGRPVTLSLFQVWRAVRRKRDPIPAYQRGGRWQAWRPDVAAWADRQRQPPMITTYPTAGARDPID